MNRAFKIFLRILAIIAVCVSFLAFFSAKWYIDTYGDVGFESIIFTLFAGLDGAASDLYLEWINNALIPTILSSAVACAFILFGSKFKMTLASKKSGKSVRLYPFKAWLKTVICLVLCCCLLWSGASIVKLPEYIKNMSSQTAIYNDDYVSPDKVSIAFPESKRNLIYIYLESMETTFLSRELGGSQDENMIPELYQLADENINFSHNDRVGGWPNISDTTWTVGAIVGQTSGVPLTIPVDVNSFGKYSRFLPGLTTLSDVLKKEGYYQAVLFGSDKAFGGRDKFFYDHGTDIIYDHSTASKDGIIPEGYRVWWGFEDTRLYTYAKKILTEISSSDKPFAFTMLTADTHHVGGYVCEKCDNKYGEQYENVYSCSSRQAYEFISWIKEQPFYENTTIVICGDHLSMDADYFNRKGIAESERHIYNCFINSAVSTDHSKNRAFSTMDIFPTVLASMGCKIEGDRLGLGVNLFSGSPTLCEQHGTDWLNTEIKKGSSYYMNNFVK